MFKHLFTLFLLAGFTLNSHAASVCSNLFLQRQLPNAFYDYDSFEQKGQAFETNPATIPVIEKALELASDHKWPVKFIDVGPAQRKVTRIFIGVDRDNMNDVQAYRDAFVPDEALGGANAGTLPLEYAHEPKAGIQYVYGYLRDSADPKGMANRQGWTGETNDGAFPYMDNYNGKEPISHYANLIGITKNERKNFSIYMKKPELRGPTKQHNCIAWSASIELGKTAKDATPEERRHLFTELGMSRASVPEEISRRFIHAANERHRVIFVFYRGSKGGLDAFEHLEQNLTPEPKIPYSQIIKGFAKGEEEIDKAVSVIPDGSKVFLPIAAGASPEGVDALLRYAKTLKNGLDIHLLVNGISEATLKKAMEDDQGKIRLHALFLGGNLRQLHKEGKVNVIPGYLGDFPRFVENGHPDFAYDAIIVRVSKEEENGFHSLGPNHDMIQTIIKSKPNIKIIAEINKNVPYVPTGTFLHKDQFAATFHSDAELGGPAVVPLTEVEKNIGQYLGKLIPSSATIQVGIGNVFGGLPEGLKSNNVENLEVWTEMYSDPLKELQENGQVIDATTGFVFGSTKLYNWLNNNRSVKIASTADVNNPATISAIRSFHAINTALQVNLRGDVNATHGPEGRVSSPGGQVEFMWGATRSRGGKAIIAIRSTAKQGEISTITLDNYDGTVTTPHENVTHVVTEYGIAELAGKDERTRALNLIRVAHPKFRKSLAKEAVKRKIIKAEDLGEFK